VISRVCGHLFCDQELGHVSALKTLHAEGILHVESRRNFFSSFTCVRDENINLAVHEQHLAV
jgi:hypothetical protein